MTPTLPRKRKILSNYTETMNDFIVFIISHNNADLILTVDTLNKYGYTGDWAIVLGDDEPMYKEYVARFGADKVVQFKKAKVSPTFDHMDNEASMNSATYARNECFNIARQWGYTYFMVLDDDYYEFQFRYAEEGKLKTLYPTSLDVVFEALLDYFISVPEMKTLCVAQNGDFLGGVEGSHFKARCMRKAMNSFICSVDRPFTFVGRLNEDVNTYCLFGSRGDLFLTIMDVSINQNDTQQKNRRGGMRKGGLITPYTADGTYCKSFYTVMCCPSFCKIGIIGNNHARIHHSIKWENAVPKIISDKYRKGDKTC